MWSITIVNFHHNVNEWNQKTLQPKFSGIHLSLFFISESWVCNNLDWLVRSCPKKGKKRERNIKNMLQQRIVVTKRLEWWKITLETGICMLTSIVWELKQKETKNTFSVITKILWIFFKPVCKHTYLVPKNSCIFTSWSNFLNVFFSA